MRAVGPKLCTASAEVDAGMPTEAPLEVSCELCRQSISCTDGTYRFYRCRGYVKLDEGYFHKHFPGEDVLTLKILSGEKWVKFTRSGKFRATEMKAGLVKVYNVSHVEIMSFNVVKGRMCDKRRKRVREDTVVVGDGEPAAAEALQGPVAPVPITLGESANDDENTTDDFVDNQNDFIEYENDAFMPIETLVPPTTHGETFSLQSLPFERRSVVLLTVFLLLGVAFGVAYNLVRVESGTVLEVEEVLVPEVMEEPVVVDNPKIEKQKTLNTIEDVTEKHEDWPFTLFVVADALVLLVCMPRLCLNH